MEERNIVTLSELEKMALEDELWEEDAEKRKMIISALHNMLCGV